MKNTLIGLLIILFFSACVKRYEICENYRITGGLIVKDEYSEQDSVRISTKNIRINNKTITEFKKEVPITTKDIFYMALYVTSTANNPYLYTEYVINDTTINFKIPSGQYSFGCYISNSFHESSCIGINDWGTSFMFNVSYNPAIQIPIPNFDCPVSTTSSYIYFNNTSKNATSYEWDFGDPESGIYNTSTDVNSYHYFQKPNLTSTTITYTVTLTAKNSFTTQSISKPITIIPTR